MQGGEPGWRVLAQLLDEHRQPPGKPGEVPVVAAGLDEPPGAGKIRFHDEALDAYRAGRNAPRRVDVTETRGWKGRLQSHCDQRLGIGSSSHGRTHSRSSPRRTS